MKTALVLALLIACMTLPGTRAGSSNVKESSLSRAARAAADTCRCPDPGPTKPAHRVVRRRSRSKPRPTYVTVTKRDTVYVREEIHHEPTIVNKEKEIIERPVPVPVSCAIVRASAFGSRDLGEGYPWLGGGMLEYMKPQEGKSQGWGFRLGAAGGQSVTRAHLDVLYYPRLCGKLEPYIGAGMVADWSHTEDLVNTYSVVTVTHNSTIGTEGGSKKKKASKKQSSRSKKGRHGKKKTSTPPPPAGTSPGDTTTVTLVSSHVSERCQFTLEPSALIGVGTCGPVGLFAELRAIFGDDHRRNFGGGLRFTF